MIGTRLYRVAYDGVEYFFSEHLQIGSPSYYQGVNPNVDLEAGWARLRPFEVTEMVEDTGNKFEFGTMSFFNGKQSREYKKLFGKTFKLKNCG